MSSLIGNEKFDRDQYLLTAKGYGIKFRFEST